MVQVLLHQVLFFLMFLQGVNGQFNNLPYLKLDRITGSFNNLIPFKLRIQCVLSLNITV